MWIKKIIAMHTQFTKSVPTHARYRNGTTHKALNIQNALQPIAVCCEIKDKFSFCRTV